MSETQKLIELAKKYRIRNVEQVHIYWVGLMIKGGIPVETAEDIFNQGTAIYIESGDVRAMKMKIVSLIELYKGIY